MFKNYILVAIRNLTKYKSHLFINSFGLGIAMACCISAYLFAAYNFEFDDFHKSEKVKHIFRLHSHILSNDGNRDLQIGNPLPLAPMAIQDIAGINSFVRYVPGSTNISYQNNAFSEQIAFSDSTIFEMFDYPLIAGNHEAFKGLQSIFLTESLAHKYFGEQDPIGKVLTLSFNREVEKKVTVGGVLKKIPTNNSMVFGAIIRIEHFEELRALEKTPWSDIYMPATFFELEDPKRASEMSTLFDRYVRLRNENRTNETVEKYSLHSFSEKVDPNEIGRSMLNSPIPTEVITLFSALAIMILLIACFNLTNTSIALTANRMKEIGVRKSIGARKKHIAIQFLIETLLIVLISLIVGYAISRVIVPEFAAMWDLPYGLKDMNGLNMIIALVILVFIAAILAGIYPALFGSKLNTIALLKGSVKIKGTNMMTRLLTTLQFSISVIMLISGLIFIQNTEFQENYNFGYDKKEILTIHINNSMEFHTMEAKAMANPKIKAVGVADVHAGYGSFEHAVKYNGEEFSARHFEVGKNYFGVMGFTFIYGKPFDATNAAEMEKVAVVSQGFLKKINLVGDPVGQTIELYGNKRRITGVIEDFTDHLYSKKLIEAFVFIPSKSGYWKTMLVKAETQNLAAVDDFMGACWKDIYPTKPYNSQFQDDVLLGQLRKMNGNMKKIFFFLTILGGFLSVAGIYSLASLNIKKRTKEIGIRKTLGATINNLIVLINREFVLIMTFAVFLGSFGGFFGTGWLLELISEVHVPIGMAPIMLSGILIFIIGISTTSITIFKAAQANPVDSLRDE